MKNLIRLIAIIAAIGTPDRLTLQEMSALYKAGLYPLSKFGERAASWKRTITPISWGRQDPRSWIPFPGWVDFDGGSSGYIKVTTWFDVEDRKCDVKWRRIESDLKVKFTSQPPLIWPDPNQPPEDIVELAEPMDPNTLLSIIDGRIKQDPNDPGLPLLRNLLTGE